MKLGYQKELPSEARLGKRWLLTWPGKRGESQAFSSDAAKKALTFGLVGLVLLGSWNIFSSLLV